MLRHGLRRRRIATIDHDIWADPAAAEVVRHHAGGNETVPTVVIGDAAMVNPSARQVAKHLADHAPHLLTDDAS